MRTIYVQITATKGSTPREKGTVMAVTAQGIEGTIGGGALELEAITLARRMLIEDRPETTRRYPLGPHLGQCCGGAVTLLFGRSPQPVAARGFVATHPVCPAPARPLWVWGAGHVGRAIVAQAAPTCGFDITWVDSTPDRFPASLPAKVTALPSADMPRTAAFAPVKALHLIVTYSHDIDLALSAALLRRGAGFIGLIGSDTKWARFSKRLRAMSLDPHGITCPIGDRSLGKHPDSIASGTVSAFLAQVATKETA